MKTYQHILASFAALAISLAGGTAFAEAIGAPGQISIQGDFDLGFKVVDSGGDNSDSVTTISVLPALDYFAAPNLSIGAQVGIRHNFLPSGAVADGVTEIVLGPRIGYVIGLGKISIWPRAGLDYLHLSVDGGNDASVMLLDLFAPLLFHPVDHFFVGFGPQFQVELYESNDGPKGSLFGLQSVVGGYF